MNQREKLAPNVENYLNMLVEMTGKVPPNSTGMVIGLHDFVLSFGVPMPKGRLPEGVEIAEPKMCYMNATNLARSNPKRFVYCEGFAMGVIPVAHAWCVDLETGRVVDPTWAAIGGVGEEYWGVPFQAEFLRLSLVNRGYYGLIENWEEGFPLLHEPLACEPERWLFSEKLSPENPA